MCQACVNEFSITNYSDNKHNFILLFRKYNSNLQFRPPRKIQITAHASRKKPEFMSYCHSLGRRSRICCLRLTYYVRRSKFSFTGFSSVPLGLILE